MLALSLFIRRLLRREEGQSLTEYGLLLFFIAVVAILAVTALGEKVADTFQSIADALS
jgi:Flp pilus assembly pilin Flp